MWIVAWLSQNSVIGYGWAASRSFNKASNQVTSLTVTTIALYSALAEDLETIDYFLDFQVVSESAKKMQ